ncbi:cytochrome ubiquinol oxidase subunit I [Sulfuriroseicoccus oceanibius]|uniref:Cytochrome ubiquinol oxidase subunit I n=1 Tax=Sulfuriroseicoccus oceanibius TaxID=2707525 RepID=A0A6B3L5T9_9BACT|nr:cytochrome ubiquinol oxidase subunit I [Sulfuriroseicoccus oceanibius]QQL44132.1 cytochrome ubiquinol oxidase subunit I [Sulfuriroseicoccus oceanibius]
MDEFLLSRIQFAANITFHILFPTITISLGWILLFFKLRYRKTRDYKWMELYFFFTKVFALTFSLGVVTGVTMSFQFGTNWPGYMNTVGNIAGPLLAYEVLTAFFLEATFLGVMLYGFRRVPSWLHTLATFLVAAGTTLSAFWIITLDSWMQTPTGHVMIDGVAHAENWLRIIFNPSMPYRVTHTLIGSGLTAAFLVAGLLAYRALKGDTRPAVKAGIAASILIAAALGPLQGLVGDLHGVNTRDHQPAKLAAMEALWESGDGVHLLLFAVPDEENRTNKFEVGIPKLGSLIITRDPDGHVQGLNEFEGLHPRVGPVFWSFRIMLGVGMTMIAVALFGTFLLWRRKQFPRWFLKVLIAMTFSGWVGSVAGWYVTEIGRQPWLVQGILLTKDAVADIPPSHVALTLTAYLVTYTVLGAAYIGALFYLARKEMTTQRKETQP